MCMFKHEERDVSDDEDDDDGSEVERDEENPLLEQCKALIQEDLAWSLVEGGTIFRSSSIFPKNQIVLPFPKTEDRLIFEEF